MKEEEGVDEVVRPVWNEKSCSKFILQVLHPPFHTRPIGTYLRDESAINFYLVLLFIESKRSVC